MGRNVSPEEIFKLPTPTPCQGWALCYNIRMSTTHNIEETTRPACCVCAGSDTLCGVCEEILDRANMAEADAQADATEDPGYEADEEHLLYWDQHAEG